MGLLICQIRKLKIKNQEINVKVSNTTEYLYKQKIYSTMMIDRLVRTANIQSTASEIFETLLFNISTLVSDIFADRLRKQCEVELFQ